MPTPQHLNLSSHPKRPELDHNMAQLEEMATLSPSDVETDTDQPMSNKAQTHGISIKAPTFALCLVVVTHSYLLISVYPYSGFMAADLIEGVDRENAGSYAGLLSASLMLGRVFSSYPWGVLADLYGRRFVLLSSLALCGIFSLAFGFSQTFSWALITRFMLGLSNGLIGQAKTVVSELARGDHALEKWGMGLVIGVWGYGMIIGPAVSGPLSEPMTQYPDAHWFNGAFDGILTSSPFILPNLVGTLFCAVSFIAVMLLVEETLPEQRRRSPCFFFCDFGSAILTTKEEWDKRAKTFLMSARALSFASEYDEVYNDFEESDVEVVSEGSGLLSTMQVQPSYQTPTKEIYIKEFSEEAEVAKPTISSIMRRKVTREHLLVMWLFAFASSFPDEAFPLFSMSEKGGLSLSESKIALVLTTCGLLFVAIQYPSYNYFAHKFGEYRTMTIGGCLCTMPFILMPLSIWMNGGVEAGELSGPTLAFLSSIMACSKTFTSMYFAIMSVVLNRTVDASQRASMNGLSTLGGSLAKAAAPACTGWLVSLSYTSKIFSPRVGSFFIFFVIGFLGLVVGRANNHLSKLQEEETLEVRSRRVSAASAA